MAAYSSGDSYQINNLVEDYDGASLGQGSVVDLGGGRGLISIGIVQRVPASRIVVQDLLQIVQPAAAEVPRSLASRVQSIGHEIFTPQQV